MNTRKTREMLWLSTACLLGAAMSVVCLHVVFPADRKPMPHATPAPSTSESTDTHSSGDRIDPTSLQRVASKNIRQQLFDPPLKPVKPPPPKPLPPIELISTILGDNGQHRAWVRDGQTLRKIVVGDILGTAGNPAAVISIEVDRLVLRHEDKRVEVGQQSTTGGRRK